MSFGIEEAEIAPGTVGLLIDETPRLTLADVRPFVWAIMLFRKGVAAHEVVASIAQVCAHEELYSGWSDDVDDDRTRLEYLVEEVLGDMTATGLVEYNEEKDLWVLQWGSNKRNMPTIIKAVAGIDGSLPAHLRLDS